MDFCCYVIVFAFVSKDSPSGSQVLSTFTFKHFLTLLVEGTTTIRADVRVRMRRRTRLFHRPPVSDACCPLDNDLILRNYLLFTCEIIDEKCKGGPDREADNNLRYFTINCLALVPARVLDNRSTIICENGRAKATNTFMGLSLQD